MTWYLIRSAGVVAYILLSASTIWGLLLSTKIIKEMVPAGLAMVMHSALSWLAIVFTGLHMVILLLDSFFDFHLSDLLIPFTGPYRPFWVGLGGISIYLAVVTSLSFSFRKRMGQVWWRRVHYMTFVTYLLATIHGIMSGKDSGRPGMQVLYLTSGLLVLFLTNYRIITASRSHSTSGSRKTGGAYP